MLTIQQSQNASAAAKYFRESLSADDYYLHESVTATWSGQLCEAVGIEPGSPVAQQQFLSLLEGRHPTTAEKLCQRLRSDRRPCIDITVSPPKSVSLAAIDDPRIERALLATVDEFIKRDVEPLIHRRRREGRYANTRQQQHVGKGLFASFLHRAARPTENGPAEPHSHVHIIAFNLTRDNQRWYAAEMERVVSQRGTLQAKFEARLASRLVELGYEPERVTYRLAGKLKQGWELRGVSRDLIERFSSRGAEIEAAAREQGLQDAVSKRGLAAKTRKRKSTTPKSYAAMKAEWRKRLTAGDRQALATLRGGNRNRVANCGESVTHALDHCFARRSTVETHELVAETLRHAVSITPEQAEAALAKPELQLLRRKQAVDGTERLLATTPEILATEREAVALAKQARGTRLAINPSYVIQREYLNDQQRNAVRTILDSKDGVVMWAGSAGTGKSITLSEAKEGCEAVGLRVFGAAPSTGAVEVMRAKGFEHSQTVERLIRNRDGHRELRDGILFVDEAGLLDMRSCRDLLQIAKQQSCRVVLIGDAKQHGSVGRGESFALLQREAGLRVAKLAKVQRQQGDYRRAVETIARGNEPFHAGSSQTAIEAGFAMLVAQGKVQQLDAEKAKSALVDRYFAETARGRSAMIVAPTHAAGAELTAEIRARLQADKKLGAETVVKQLVSLNFTDAQKRDLKNYESDHLVVQFTQNAPGFVRGARYDVKSTAGGPLLVAASGQECPLPQEHACRWEVYRQAELALAKGDLVRMTQGGKDAHGKRIVNGQSDVVSRVLPDGRIELQSGRLLSAGHGHLAHAYTATSFRAQGADADVALVSLSSQSLPAVTQRALYVAASRGKQDIHCFTDDMRGVRRALERTGIETTASELMRTSTAAEAATTRQQHDRRHQLRHAQLHRVAYWWCTQFGRREHLAPTATQQFANCRPSSARPGVGR